MSHRRCKHEFLTPIKYTSADLESFLKAHKPVLSKFPPQHKSASTKKLAVNRKLICPSCYETTYTL